MDFNRGEKDLIKKLDTPAKVQDYLNSLRFNFEKKGETLMSPLFVMRSGEAHCFEGALLGAYILSKHGFKPLVLHLQATKEDFDHVVAPFKQGGLWGAISKTNHAVLRYREPVYRDIRELAMSYFHEYFLDTGKKTMRGYSEPMDMNDFEDGWEVLAGDLWGIDQELDKVKHHKIKIVKLRKADRVEIEAGKIMEYEK